MRDTSQKADSRQFERLQSSHKGFSESEHARGRYFVQTSISLLSLIIRTEQHRYTFASQLLTLKEALSVTARLLRAKRSSLLATKLLVLARVLHKSLVSQRGATETFEELGSQLLKLRRRLLSSLDKRLVQRRTGVTDVVEDLTAFCLATSSSPTDALKHFHGLRARSIRSAREDYNLNVKECITARLELFHDTIHQSKSIFPDLLASSLKSLGQRPILEDGKILELEDLSLDVHLRWLGAEIRTYIPWTRHDELQRDIANEQVKTWTSSALDQVASAIEVDIGMETDIEVVVATRKDILQTWLSTRGAARHLDARKALDKLRGAFTRRCFSLIITASQDLSTSVRASTVDILEDAVQPSQPSKPLWNISADSKLLVDGGKAFRDQVIERRFGRTPGVTSEVSDYERCASRLESMYAAFKSMRDTRWDDDYDDSDSDDSGDETKTSNVHELLSRQDPDELLKQLREQAAAGITSLKPLLKSTTISSPTSGGVHLLRVLRELRLRILKLLSSLDSPASHSLFAERTVIELHQSLADSIVGAVSLSFQAITGVLDSKLEVRALWEGSPPLPLQITPKTFKALRALVKGMEKLGADLWNPSAVIELKRRLTVAYVRHVQSVAAELVRARGVVSDDDIEETEQGVEDRVKRADSEEAEKDAADGSEDREAPNGHEPEVHTAEEKPENESDSRYGEGNVAKASTNDFAPASKVSKLSPDNLIQLLFDTLYLQQALTPASSGSAYTSTESERAFAPLIEHLTMWCKFGEAEQARLQKNAKEYWKKTYLLFGLLCNG